MAHTAMGEWRWPSGPEGTAVAADGSVVIGKRQWLSGDDKRPRALNNLRII